MCFQKQDDEDGIPDLLDQMCKKGYISLRPPAPVLPSTKPADVDDYGASWLTDERNREILAGTHDALLRQIEKRADLRQVFVRLDPNGGVRLCPKAIAIYEAHVQEFLKRMLAPISVPSGPPLRSPELLSITYINTGARRRSVFL
ncbi:uncharacterized protein FFE2_15975 [Fusarium fujikuroi]|nr:uncharacterized protein FFE2_15975 [Fusarium fujikuroi]